MTKMTTTMIDGNALQLRFQADAGALAFKRRRQVRKECIAPSQRVQLGDDSQERGMRLIQVPTISCGVSPVDCCGCLTLQASTDDRLV